MKIGEKPPVPPASDSGASAPTAEPARPSEPFAERLEGSEPVTPGAESGGVRGPEWSDPAGDSDLVTLAARVDEGNLSADEAVALVVERVLDAQLPPDASSEVRARVRALVEASLESDPLLGALVKRLGGER